MRWPGLAFGWAFLRRHRVGFAAVGAYLVVLAVLMPLVVRPGRPLFIGSARFAFAVTVPLSLSLIYLLVVFSFGYAGDIAGRPSLFPARMLALPVSTAALVRWPMLFGAIGMVMLWLAAAILALRPAGIHVPLLWPSVLGVVLIWWVQALMWLPFGAAGVRVALAVALLVIVDGVVLLAIHLDLPTLGMLAALMPQLPVAYFAAFRGVTLARRGYLPDWRGWWQSGGARPPRWTPDAFPSAARAQRWLEWRANGRTLPAAVALVLPFELSLLGLATDTALVAEIVLASLMTPVVFAALGGRGSCPMSSYDATRPLSTASLLATKLLTMVRSTLVAWMLVLLAIPIGLRWSHRDIVLLDGMHRLSAHIGVARTVALPAILITALVFSTWKQLAQRLYIALSGKIWLRRIHTAALLTAVCVCVPLADWIDGSIAIRTALWHAIPGILATLVGLKLALLARTMLSLWRERLVGDTALVLGAATWVAAVFAVYAVLAWLAYGPVPPTYLLMMIAILVVPITRVAAAPLVIARSRHG